MKDFKNDDAAAKKVIEAGLRRLRDTATAEELARTAAMLAEIDSAAGE